MNSAAKDTIRIKAPLIPSSTPLAPSEWEDEATEVNSHDDVRRKTSRFVQVDAGEFSLTIQLAANDTRTRREVLRQLAADIAEQAGAV